MSVYQVPQPKWAELSALISGRQQGEPVSIDLIAAPAGARRVAESRPLAALELADSATFAVSVTDPPQVIEVAGPTAMLLEQSAERTSGRLTVDAASGEQVVIHFEEPIVLGIVDGLP